MDEWVSNDKSNGLFYAMVLGLGDKGKNDQHVLRDGILRE